MLEELVSLSVWYRDLEKLYLCLGKLQLPTVCCVTNSWLFRVLQFLWLEFHDVIHFVCSGWHHQVRNLVS